MKKKINLSLIFLLFLTLCACQKPEEELIINTWRVSFNKTFESFSEKQKSALRNLSKEEFLKQKEMMESISFILKKDNTFNIKGLSKKVQEGKWQLSKDKKKLLLKSSNRETYMYIEEIREEKLVLSTNNSKQSIKFVLIPT